MLRMYSQPGRGCQRGWAKVTFLAPHSSCCHWGVPAPSTFLDAPRVRVGTLPHTEGETEAQVPNGESGVFFTPLFCLLGDPTKSLFVRTAACQKLWQLPWATPTQLVTAGSWLPLGRLAASQPPKQAPCFPGWGWWRVLSSHPHALSLRLSRGAWCPVSLSLKQGRS